MKKFKKGVTVVELLIYMGIFSILIVVLMDLFVAMIQVKQRTAIQTGLDIDSRFIMNRMQYDINRASNVTDPNALGATSNALTLVIGGQNYTYGLNSNNLELTNPDGTNPVNSSETEITSITFKKLGNNVTKSTIKVDLTLKSKTQKSSGFVSKTYSGVFGQR